MNSNLLLSMIMNVLVLDVLKSTKAECAIIVSGDSIVEAYWLSPLIWVMLNFVVILMLPLFYFNQNKK